MWAAEPHGSIRSPAGMASSPLYVAARDGRRTSPCPVARRSCGADHARRQCRARRAGGVSGPPRVALDRDGSTDADRPHRTFFSVLHIVVVIGALAAFAGLVALQTRSTAVALAVAIGVGMGPLFPAALAPPEGAAAFGICAAAALVYIGCARHGTSHVASLVLPCGVPTIAALIAPPFLLPAAAIDMPRRRCGVARPKPRASICDRSRVGSGAHDGVARRADRVGSERHCRRRRGANTYGMRRAVAVGPPQST